MDIEEYSKRSPQFYSDKIPTLLKHYLNVKNYSVLLDAGCGDGSLLYALFINGFLKERKVIAIDLSKNRIKLLNSYFSKKCNNIIASVDNVEDLVTVPNESVDLLISNQVIEHVNDKKFLNTIYRVMKKDGIVYLTTIQKKKFAWYFYRNGKNWVLDPTHLKEYESDTELLSILNERDFEILENRKELIKFSLIDFIIKNLGIENRELLVNSKLAYLRKLKIPIFGYYNWTLVFLKK
jgi:2-polyprenyl-3-methyl-5-hydroxy-6-metoxy-1,4-benzoquinol methylase